MTPDIQPLSKPGKRAVMELLQSTPEFTEEEVLVAEEVIDCYLRDPADSGYLAFVAFVDDRVTGYVCYGPTPLTQGTWDIYWIAVSPSARSQGVGTSLIRFAEGEITGKGGRLSIIETSSKQSYEQTRLFYYGLGYTTACTVADFYAPGDDKVILQKRLCP